MTRWAWRVLAVTVYFWLIVAVAVFVALWAVIDQALGGEPPYQVRGPVVTLFPDPRLTPGATLTTKAYIVCRPGYARRIRAVPDAVKRHVLAAYGIEDPPEPGAYEIDHLIPLELGGSNDIRNLWPQPLFMHPGAHEKDRVEAWLHHQVCRHHLDLAEAQRRIQKDWYAVYVECCVGLDPQADRPRVNWPGSFP